MKTRILSYIVFGVLGVACSSHGYAADSNRAFLMKGIRPLGMGDAFLATHGSDSNAMFYNPAAINDYEKKLHGNFLSPTIDVGTQSLQLLSDVQDLADDIGDATTDAAKNDAFGAFTAANVGRVENYRVSMPLAMIMHRYFAVGLVVDSENQVALRDPSFDSFDFLSRTDGGVVAGTAWGWFDGKVQTGIALKGLYRVFTRETITQRDVVVNDDLADSIDIGQGFGVGVDIGAKAALPESLPGFTILKPVVAVTYQDIGNTRFSGNEVEDKAQSVSAGVTLNPKTGSVEHTFAFDFRDLTHKADFITLFHAGYEVRFPKIFKTQASVRIGANQGYFSTGATLDWRYAKLAFATYGEEFGDVSRTKEMRRYGAELAFGF